MKIKKSNKILLILVASYAMGFVLYAVDIRYFGIPIKKYPEMQETFIPINNVEINHITLEGVSQLDINLNDSRNGFLLKRANDSITMEDIKYTFSRDSLYISSKTIIPKYGRHINLKLNSSLKSITMNNSKIGSLSNFRQGSLTLKLGKSELKNLGSIPSHINFLNINAVNSFVTLQNFKIDSLSTRQNDSNLTIHREADWVRADLTMNSKLNLKDVTDLQYEKDSTSRIVMK